MFGHIRSAVNFTGVKCLSIVSSWRLFTVVCVCADLSSSPPGPYGQQQYVFKPEEHLKAPPILPPHLLQVILNKDTNISVSVVVQFMRSHSLIHFAFDTVVTAVTSSHREIPDPVSSHCSVTLPCCLNPITSC